MRYLFICLAAFLLFASAAFAADPVPPAVNVTVKIGDLYDVQPWVALPYTFTVTPAALTAGFMEVDEIFTGDVKTNFGWALNAKINSALTGSLVLSLRGNDGSDVWIDLTTTAQEIMAEPAGIWLPSLDMKLSGLSWTTPPQADQVKTITFSFV